MLYCCSVAAVAAVAAAVAEIVTLHINLLGNVFPGIVMVDLFNVTVLKFNNVEFVSFQRFVVDFDHNSVVPFTVSEQNTDVTAEHQG